MSTCLVYTSSTWYSQEHLRPTREKTGRNTLVSHGIFVAAQGVEKFSLSGIVDQDPVLDRNHQLGTVRAEAQIVDGIALGFVVPLWHLAMKGKRL